MFATLMFNLILLLFILWIFRNNKTSHILGYSVLVFLSVFIYFTYLGFEFMALVFIITYIGGIAVMFLFLILVLDVNPENIKPKRAWFQSSYLALFIICSILFSVKILLDVYNPFIFNNFEFFEFITNRVFEALEKLIAFSDISKDFSLYGSKSLSNYINFTKFLGYNQNSCSNLLLLTHEYIWNDLFKILWHQNFTKFSVEDKNIFYFGHIFSGLTNNFSDVIALGVTIFRYYGFLLIFVAIYLLVALIVSIYVGSGIFQIEKN